MTQKNHKKALAAEQKSLIFLAALIALLLLIFSLCSEWFFVPGNLFNIVRQIADIGMIAIPTAILIIAGNIDMSLGSTLGFCAICFGLMMNTGLPIPAAAVLTVGIGLIIGVVNGFFVSVLKIPGIVSTIGTMVLYGRGKSETGGKEK